MEMKKYKRYFELANKENAADYDYSKCGVEKEIKCAIDAWEKCNRPNMSLDDHTNEVILTPFKTKYGNLAFTAYCHEVGKSAFKDMKKYAEEMPEIKRFDISKMEDEPGDYGCIYGSYYIYTNIKFNE